MIVTGCAQRVPAQTTWNSSFEEGMKDWQPPVIKPMPGQKPGNNSVTLTSEKTHDGKQALQFDVGSWSPSITVRSQLQPLINNAPYQQVRLWDLYEGARGRQFGARVQLYDAQRNPLPGNIFTGNGSYIPDGDWFPITINFDVPPEARYYTVELFWAAGTGKVTFDDISLSAIAAPVAVKTGYTLAALSNAQHTLWTASALEKVYPGATPPQATGTQLNISAAQGESQSVQLIFKPQNMQNNLAVSVSDLKSLDGTKILSATNIDIRYVGNVDVKGDVAQFGRGGLTPDPLFPTAPDAVNAGKPQSLWITANVPRDAAPGIYTTSVHLKTAQEQIAIPLKLEVFDFALPEQPALKTIAFSNGMASSARDTMRRHLLANRITTEIGYGGGVQSLSLALNPDNTVTVDWAPWDAAMQKYFSDGMDQFLVPCLLFGDISSMYGDGVWQYVKKSGAVKYGTPEWRTAVASYVQQMYAHLQQRGWLKNAVWEIWDEPMGKEKRAIVRDIAALVRQNAPEAKIMVTGWPTDPVDPNIDIWCPQQSLYQPQLRQLSKGNFWIYNNGLFSIDNPVSLTKMRNQAWWMWNNDITGLLWWSITYGWNGDLYNNLTPYPKQNGNGFLFYPGVDGDKSKVIDSMRIAAYRAGVNDYDYFTLLADAQDAAIERNHLSGKVPSGKELVDVLLSAGIDKNDPDLLEQIRNFTARLIVFTKHNPNIALKLAPDYWRTSELKGYIKPGTKVLFGDQKITADADGKFKMNFSSTLRQ